ncbi:hypothetical protein [Cohnella sp. JJ-181]|uniref:hypothetical protein n=1 Tax=Cohnella rhizoplanae TaxID=2974897 RepID=UPI0022FFAA88|nr:hypothetical protein [Cohnella sp. JJ-181]CAI6082644.1 hypothetical protein COHCIP112018_03710 [Cohnella sp. JJ-181]
MSFYESLGFNTVQTYTRPNPYAVVRYGSLELHFYGTKRILPNENPQMCYIEVDDVDGVYEQFASGLKRRLGKIPRSGIPRISKIKQLAEDRRFMVTDVGGNTFYIGMRNADPAFFRTIESAAYAQNFETLYDLLYSKEDYHAAFKMWEKFFPAADLDSIEAGDLDLAKIWLVALDIHLQRDQAVNPSLNEKLQTLLDVYSAADSPDWDKISHQYREMMDGE